MKQKQRVPISTDYWWISHGLGVHFQMDNRMPFDDDCFEAGNYFPDKESAEAMAEKLRAVLKGADVIEMPSEEQFDEYLNTHFPYKGYTKGVLCEITKGEWKECFRYLKSKVK